LDAVNLALCFLIFGLIVYPLVFVVSASFSDSIKMYQDPIVFLPRAFNVESYVHVFNYPDVWRGYRNSILYTALGTAINLVMTTLAAYPLSRRRLYGRSVFMVFFVFTMFFSGGIIPQYLVNRTLGILDTVWVIVLPMAIVVFNMIVMMTYFQTTIPHELEESASIDGCSDFGILLRVVLPLSVPIVAVLALFYGVMHWNQYFQALIYLSNHDLYPLQLVLRNILILDQISEIFGIAQAYDERYAERIARREGLKYAIVVVSCLPLLIIYPALNKYLKKGIMIGSLKG